MVGAMDPSLSPSHIYDQSSGSLLFYAMTYVTREKTADLGR
jgi:hypothetical protein